MDKEIETLWDDFGDIPMDEDANGELILSCNWQHFKKGARREEIWHWFDHSHSKGVYWLLYDREREDE